MVTRITQEIQALNAIGRGIQLFLGVVICVVAVGCIGMVYLARRADKVALLWGFMEFGLSDRLRELQEKSQGLERDLKRARLFFHDAVGLIANLRRIDGATIQDTQHHLRVCADSASKRIHPNVETLRVSVWIHEPGSNKLSIWAGHGIGSRTIQNLQFAPGEGFAGKVFSTRSFQRYSRGLDDPSMVKADPDSRYPIEHMMGVPIWVDGDEGGLPIGALCFSHAEQGVELAFDTNHSSLAYFYADLAGVAVGIAKARGLIR